MRTTTAQDVSPSQPTENSNSSSSSSSSSSNSTTAAADVGRVLLQCHGVDVSMQNEEPVAAVAVAVCSTTRNNSLEDERERFRHFVRDSLLAEMAVIEAEEPTVKAEQASSPRPRRFAILLMVAVATIVVSAIIGTRAIRRRKHQPAELSNEPVQGNEPLLVFTKTTQLYQAVDDYEEAIQANGTAKGSLVALHYGYPMGTWDVSRLTDFSRVFMLDRTQRLDLHPLRSYRHIPSLSGWNVSRATTMQAMFAGAVEFTGDGLVDWDVGLVTDFSYCFWRAEALVGGLSQWNTSSARNLSSMFYEATSFNDDLSSWNVGRVEDMSYMFYGAQNFRTTTADNDGDAADMSRWNVARVKDMRFMFGLATVFDGNVSTWNVRNVRHVEYMFNEAHAFSGDVSAWSLRRVTSLEGLFANATSFVGGDLSGWSTHRISSLWATFEGCSIFNGNVSKWNVSRVYDFTSTFEACTSFHGDLSRWNMQSAQSLSRMFKNAQSFNTSISSWNTSKVGDMSEMFHNAKAFNSDVSSWDVGNLLFGAGIFKGAGAFNHSLCSWRDKLPVGFDFDFDWNPLDVADMFHQSGCIDTSDPLLGDGSQSWSGPFCTSCVD